MAPAALLGVGELTTLDELVVAAVERGLDDRDLRHLLLGYRDGESAAAVLFRLFPLEEQLEQLVLSLAGEER